MAFVQKIYDSSLEKFVYYTKAIVDTAPLSTETTPNHTNNLVVSTHAVIAETGATLSVKDEGSTLTVNTSAIDFVGAGISSTFSGDEVTVTVTGTGMLGAHATTHISGGSDEINGDQLDIDYTPANYTATLAGGLTTSTQHLTSHLKGIDDYLATVGGGEVNTASNIGTGLGWFKQKAALNLEFKSVILGYGLTGIANTNDITISKKTAVQTLTSGASITINADNGPHYELVIGTDALLQNPTNSLAGKKIEIIVQQDATGARKLSFDSDWIPVGNIFQLAQNPNSYTVLKAVARGVSPKWYYTLEHAEETEVTPAIISTNQNSWDPAGRSYASLLRISTDTNSRELRGILAPVQGFENKKINIVVTGSNYLIIKHENAAASASNRILIQTEKDITIVPGDFLSFLYDFTSQRWRLV